MKFSQFSHELLTWFGSTLVFFVLATSVYAQAPNTVLATVNERPISQADVDASIISQLFPLQQQIYALRKSALDNLVTRAVLEAEARKRGVPVDELKKQLTAGEISVTANQIETVYQENASAFVAMSPDEAKERLRLDLESQARMRNYRAALTALRNSLKIDVRLEEPRLPLKTEVGSAPERGPRDAPVTIVEFSDFQCPYCRDAQSVVKQILKEYPNDVRLVFKHLPLDIHDRAFASAQAAFCAGEQGRFWEFHDGLFGGKDLSENAISTLAKTVRLDLGKFRSCLTAESSRGPVIADLEEARRLGINSTPTFIVNGKPLRGAVGIAEFKEAIEQELKISRANGPLARTPMKE